MFVHHVHKEVNAVLVIVTHHQVYVLLVLQGHSALQDTVIQEFAHHVLKILNAQ